MALNSIGYCVLSHSAKIEAKLIPPWFLAEGVLSEATLTPFKYTYYCFIMHGMQFILILTRFADVPCPINTWLSYSCVQK